MLVSVEHNDWFADTYVLCIKAMLLATELKETGEEVLSNYIIGLISVMYWYIDKESN